MKLDLHTHSTYSDGTLDPGELIEKAAACDITHIALSDHDSTAGISEAREKAKILNLSILSAVEINSRENTPVHILGYHINEEDPEFQNKLKRHREIRIHRTHMILEKLQKMGIKIAMSDFHCRPDSAAIGRPHIADKLKEKGLVFSRQEAFGKYLGQGKPAYVFYDGPTPEEAIAIILACKGVPVLAHPGFSVTEEMMTTLIKSGLQGLEVYYPSHNSMQIQNFLEIARRFDLVYTGGSDYHGPGSGHESLGEIPVPEKILELLAERKQKLFP